MLIVLNPNNMSAITLLNLATNLNLYMKLIFDLQIAIMLFLLSVSATYVHQSSDGTSFVITSEPTSFDTNSSVLIRTRVVGTMYGFVFFLLLKPKKTNAYSAQSKQHVCHHIA